MCNGPGAVYECSCNDIQKENAIAGSEEDAIGVAEAGATTTWTLTTSTTTKMLALAWMPAAFAADLAPFPLRMRAHSRRCDCDGNQLDAVGDCGGACAEDLDNDGVCDDIDSCVGTVDPCGVCNGPGVVYECGCDDLPEGDCDCNGNQVDALGICAGTCDADVDGDGVCDDVDTCIGAFDACGICNGPGQIYECGCDDIPAGDYVAGNRIDALGVCGGACDAGVDGDGICDDVDDCVGAFDACGVCNG